MKLVKIRENIYVNPQKVLSVETSSTQKVPFEEEKSLVRFDGGDKIWSDYSLQETIKKLTDI
jgi:hypothetical protein